MHTGPSSSGRNDIPTPELPKDTREKWGLASRTLGKTKAGLETLLLGTAGSAMAGVLGKCHLSATDGLFYPLHVNVRRIFLLYNCAGDILATSGVQPPCWVCRQSVVAHAGSAFDISGPRSIAEALGILAAIITIHECGHFAAARLQGIHVTKFAIGFGPPLLSYQVISPPSPP